MKNGALPLAITLDGAFFCAQACLPSMLENGGGAIVTLGGMQSLSGAKHRVHGSVAKHGLVGMTRALAREFGDRGVRANCIAPGTMNTTRAAGPRGASRAQGHSARALRRGGRNRERGALPRRSRRKLPHRPDHPGQRRPDDVLKAVAGNRAWC